MAACGDVTPVVVSSVVSLLGLDPASYARHPLHDDDRDWPETNCYTDLWLELLHALGVDPVAALGVHARV